ncbi:hypothetical protein AMECASPLE_036710 [Ameca splendens]|uniref:Uncharacterized protein n=1 Tax=Ameca splendens TaxID=208324 RepID=A0ABV0ZH76_9TELE
MERRPDGNGTENPMEAMGWRRVEARLTAERPMDGSLYMWSLEGSLAEDYCRIEADWLAQRHTEKPLGEAGGGPGNGVTADFL